MGADDKAEMRGNGNLAGGRHWCLRYLIHDVCVDVHSEGGEVEVLGKSSCVAMKLGVESGEDGILPQGLLMES